MSADEEFPRGWTQFELAINPLFCTFTIPASPGVIHVLDFVYVKVANQTAAASSAQQWVLNSSGGLFTNFQLLEIFVPPSPSQDADSLSTSLAAEVGASITVACSIACPAGMTQFMIIEGHDI